MIKLALRVLFFIIGAFFLYYLVHKIGAQELLAAIRGIGWKVIFVLMVPPFWLLVQAKAWQLTVEESGDHVTFWQLFKIKMSGDAANTFTPLGFIGGDPVRFAMLKKIMPGNLSAASIVLDRTMQTLAVLTVLVLSLVLATFYLNLPPAWKALFPFMTVMIGLFLWFFIHHQKKGLFKTIARIASKFGVKQEKIDNMQSTLHSMDEKIAVFYRHNPRRFFTVYSCHLFGRFLGVVEIYLIAHLTNIDLPWIGALFMASLAVIVNILFTFIPGSMGIMEGAYGALCMIIGLTTLQGVAIQLIRRFRALVWISLGVLFMIVYSPKKN